MLPASSYPELKKHKHLKGNFGGAWQLQRMEFAMFPGPIVLTSNCIIEPKKSYANRIFTRRVVGWPGVQHIEGDDMSKLIASAQASAGFTKEDVEDYPQTASLTIGFGHHTVMSVADKVIAAVKSGAIKRFFVVGGCDGAEGERSYFRDIAKAAPKEGVILSLGCGKYRFNSPRACMFFLWFSPLFFFLFVSFFPSSLFFLLPYLFFFSIFFSFSSFC